MQIVLGRMIPSLQHWENTGAISIGVGNTDLISEKTFTLNVGEFIVFHNSLFYTKGAALGTVEAFCINLGTGTGSFIGIGSGAYKLLNAPASNSQDGAFWSCYQCTAVGTLKAKMYATSAGSNSSVAIGSASWVAIHYLGGM